MLFASRRSSPCGSYEWQIVRLGADIGIKCLKRHHRVLLERSIFERRVKAVVSQQTSLPVTKYQL
jgi:hypothetical protein